MHEPLQGRQELGHGAYRDGADLVLRVRVTPRAKQDSVAPQPDCLKVTLTTPPVDGKANAHLCRLLAPLFGVAKSNVRVERGDGARIKRVRVVAPRRLPPFLGG